MAIVKRPEMDVDVLDMKDGITYTHSIKGCETAEKAVGKAIRYHEKGRGKGTAGWVGNVRLSSRG